MEMDTLSPPPAAPVDPNDYAGWLRSFRRIGPKITEHIMALYPSRAELAQATAEQLVQKIKGLTAMSAKAMIEAAAQISAKVESVPTVAEIRRTQTTFTPPVEEAEAEEEEASADNTDAGMGLFSKPLDFRPVREKPVTPPVSIDALRRRQQMPNSLSFGPKPAEQPAEEAKADFATFKKPDVHVIYSAGKQKQVRAEPTTKAPPGNPLLHTVLPVLFILVGAGLIGVSAWFLIKSNADNPSVTNSAPVAPISAPVSATVSDIDLQKLQQDALKLIQNPIPTTTPPATAPAITPTPTPTIPTLKPADISVQVLNGNGIKGATTKAFNLLKTAGFNPTASNNANNYAYKSTMLYFSTANLAKAELVQTALTAQYQITMTPTLYTGQKLDVVVVLGAK